MSHTIPIIIPADDIPCAPYDLQRSVYTIKDLKLYRDGVEYGDIIAQDGQQVTATFRCNNKYLNGKTVEMTLYPPTLIDIIQ